MLRKSVPVSSVLHSIATNYKQWSIRYTKRQDSFYSNYFANLSSTAYDIAKKSILLCGDIEFNPGPQTNNSTSLGIITNDRSNVLFNYRLLRHGLILTSISVIRQVLMTLNGFVKHAIITWLKTEFHHVLLSMVWYSHKKQHFLSQ